MSKRIFLQPTKQLTSFSQAAIVSGVSASRLTTVERLIFIRDLVNCKTLAKETVGTEAFAFMNGSILQLALNLEIATLTSLEEKIFFFHEQEKF